MRLSLTMSGWKRSKIDGFPVYQAATISWLPNIVQGFTTRQGGVSTGSLNSLNMSSNVGDRPENVVENRHRAVAALTGQDWPIVTAAQIHGDGIGNVAAPDSTVVGGADALITDQAETMLLLVFADCVPVYYCDPVRRVVAIAHSGWRGTAANIAGKTLARMVHDYGCERASIYAAIGPSISSARYEVGLDVVAALKDAWPGKSSSPFIPQNEFTNKFLVNLRLIVFDQIVSAGLRPEHIAVSDQCTAANRKDFFSHRRDSAGGLPTGRMAGLIGIHRRGSRFAMSFPPAEARA